MSILARAFALMMLWTQIENAGATDFEPKNKALLAILGTPKVQSKTVDLGGGKSSQLFYAKDGGKITKAAFIDSALWGANCTHTWAVGIDPATSKITQIRVIEMRCQHAFPAKENSFLSQYTGKGPADIATLKSKVSTIAKATGTCELTTDVVIRSITGFNKVKASL